MGDNIKKQHISSNERIKWDKCIVDLDTHTGAGGTVNHPLGNGSVAGFSINDYTTAEKSKLAGIDPGAKNYTHPATHPASMITGLATIATTGSYDSLTNRPVSLPASGGDASTVGGVRITINNTPPPNPVVNRELWVNVGESPAVLEVYKASGWEVISANFS